ncbi:hypothetical protein [Nesterenkonia haasae]|uniref:hypothetical protein n=1 Tax=Nesterenkonia haasae TaxID=2587813 RepID=UPI001F3C9F84|nr:hypothetical protein [Nesterenkonia haasae]
MSSIGKPRGTSSYFRLSTRPIDPDLAQIPEDRHLRERRRRHAIAGGYRINDYTPGAEDITLVGAGALMPEVLAAKHALGDLGITAGVVCLTSPDLVFQSLQHRGDPNRTPISDIINILFPPQHPAPLVTAMNGHPHTHSFLGAASGDRIRNLGVTTFVRVSRCFRPDAPGMSLAGWFRNDRGT